jgi:hypothetical protein
MVLVAAGTWLAGCGDDAKPGAPRGKGGSAGMAGSAGAATGGTGGSAGSAAGGTAGSTGGTLAGSAGTTAGSSGSSGAGTAGTSMGGEGGENQAGSGGTSGSSGTGGTAGVEQAGQGGEGGGEGGEGGASTSMCSVADLGVVLVSATGTQQHDHLPINGAFRTTLLGMINTGSPLTFTLPPEGMNVHDHTLTFTARQLNTLRNGGTVNVTTAVGGVQANRHTHTYAFDCAP